MQTPQPFPPEGVTFFGGPIDGERPTREWIGTPSQQDQELFLWLLFENIANRPQGKGGHQHLQLVGNFVTYGTPTPQMRGSDLSRRIYAAVRLLEICGETNYEACRRVGACLEGRIGSTKRGRPRKSHRPPDFLDRVQTVRSEYNGYKSRHRWPEKLPARDFELEFWWCHFLFFKTWATQKYQDAVDQSKSMRISVEDWCRQRFGSHGKLGAIISNAVRKLHLLAQAVF
jgi:hypothetical protein